MNIPAGSLFDRKLCHPDESALLEGMELFRLRGEKCPYFGDGRVRENLSFIAREVSEDTYERLLAFGWRRCGALFYKPLCPGCQDCRPLRVDSALFHLDRSQKRCLKRNCEMSISIGEPFDSDEDFELFTRYCKARHGEGSQRREEFRLFLAEPPLPSIAIRHRLQKNGRLVCVAWTDILPNSLSAVYTAFDPDLPKLGLGVFSILVQLQLCRQMSRRYLQIGFYIKDCRKMSYKRNYMPCQAPDENGEWESFPKS